MQEGGFQQNPLMRLTLAFTLVFLVAFWVTNFGMYFTRMSLAPSSVKGYYLGSEEEFREPRAAASMLETAHMHLPMMGMVLLFLTHLLIFVPLSRRPKIVLIAVTFVSALLDEGSGWLVRFVSPRFAWLKPVGFLGLQGAIAFLLGALALFLVRAARRQAATRRALDREREDDSLNEEGAVHAALE
jgi:hypothetical protein